jgi:hypothetical protein
MIKKKPQYFNGYLRTSGDNSCGIDLFSIFQAIIFKHSRIQKPITNYLTHLFVLFVFTISSFQSFGQNQNLTTQTTINVATPTITIGANPEVCRGVTSSNLSYFTTTGNPNQYSIKYDSTAQSQGFSDVTDAYLPSTPIPIKVPETVLDGTYHGTLTVKNSTSGISSSGSAISVKVNPLPNTGYNVSDTTICSSQEVTVKISGTQPRVWYYLRDNSDQNVLDSLIGSGSSRKFYFTIENSNTFNILAKYFVTGCTAALTDLSEIKIVNFNSSAWNITQFIGGDTITPTPSSVPDLYMKTSTSDFKSDNELDSLGTIDLLYRVDKNNSTKKWSFNYSISGTNLKVISTLVSGDVETPTVEGKKVNAGENNHIFIRFKIQNISRATIEAHFFIAFGIDIVGCNDEFYDDDDAAIQTIKPYQ